MKKVSLLLTFILAWQVFALDNNELVELHNKLITFYGYQRAGLKNGTAHNLNDGFTEAAHKNDNYNNTPLDGGWYDAGDFVKFGMNLGYSVYCLLKGYDVFPSAYDDNYDFEHNDVPDGIPDILNQVKYATDYLMKAVIDENTVIRDVGNGNWDHGAMDQILFSDGRGNDQVFRSEGADIPATYAACLALMSTLYRDFNPEYADSCLAKAKTAFACAKNFLDEGKLFCSYQIRDTDNQPFYYYSSLDGGGYDRQINDRLVAAGVELYRATGDAEPIYREWAKRAITGANNCMGYSFIGPLASFEAWRQELGSSSGLLNNVRNFIDTKINTSGHFKDIYRNTNWGTARDAGTAAFEFALLYITLSSDEAREEYMQKAEKHIAWLVGENNKQQSYVIGHNGGPRNIHYRVNYPGGRPVGGVVSGPDDLGTWIDDHGQYRYVEVALDYNAGAVGAVAFLRAINNPGDAIQIQQSFSASPNADVDLNSDQVTFSASFNKSVPWEIIIKGEFGTDTLSGEGTSISESWSGDAKKGFFLSGEKANATLNIKEGYVAAYDILKMKPVSIKIAGAKKPEPKPNDKLIDNFDDGDKSSETGGEWTAIGTGTGMSAPDIFPYTRNGEKILWVMGTVTSDGPQEYAGTKVTFNSEGTPYSLGSANSVIFDLEANVSTRVRVELEQANISDGAYYGIEIPVREAKNTYRLSISDFKQPDWKTTETALDLNNITALRFMVYDESGMVYMYLDNIHIEADGMSSGTAPVTFQNRATFKPVLSNGMLLYSVPQNLSGQLNLAVYNVAGQIVMRKNLNATSNHLQAVSLSKLPQGVYTVAHSIDGKMFGEKMIITHMK